MSHRYENKPVDTENFVAPPFSICKKQLFKNCYEHGELSALNHYNGADTVDLPYGIKGWNVYPYQVARPEAYHMWMAGFYAKWGELVRGEGVE